MISWFTQVEGARGRVRTRVRKQENTGAPEVHWPEGELGRHTECSHFTNAGRRFPSLTPFSIFSTRKNVEIVGVPLGVARGLEHASNRSTVCRPKVDCSIRTHTVP